MNRFIATLCVAALIMLMSACGNGDSLEPQSKPTPEKNIEETLMDKISKFDSHPELTYHSDSLNHFRGILNKMGFTW